MTMLVAVGTALLIVGMVWRAAAMRARRARLMLALASSDPNIRSSALRRISRTGLAPLAEPLLAMTRAVSDPVRTGELAWVIAATQWEPARDPRVAQLRLWADNHYRVTRLGDRAAGRTPAVLPPFAEPPSRSAPLAAWSDPVSPLATIADSTPVRSDQAATSYASETARVVDGPGLRAPDFAASAPPIVASPGIEPTPVAAANASGRPASTGVGGAAGSRLPAPRPRLVEAVESILGDTVVWLAYEPALPSSDN